MPGFGFGYGYGAVGHARRNPLMVGGGTPTPTPSPALPALGQIVGHFDSAQITPQADNSNLTQWNDLSGSTAHAGQTTAARQPKYRAAGGAGVNGMPYVQFDGVDDWLSIATPGNLKTALDSQEYTILYVVNNAQATSGSSGTVFGGALGGVNLAVWANGTSNGIGATTMAGGTAANGIGAGYQSAGFQSTKTSALGSNPNLKRALFRGTVYACETFTAGPTLGSATAAIGAGNVATTPAFFFKGNIYRIIIWSKRLTTQETMQAEIFFNAFYNQTQPAIALGRFVTIHGDSRYAGLITHSDSVGGKLSVALSQPLGTYSNTSIGGIRIDELLANASSEVDAVANMLLTLSPTIKQRLIYEEYYNSKALSVGTIGTSGTLAYQTKQYVDARKAAIPGVKIVGASPIDHASAASALLASPWANFMGAGAGGSGGSNLWVTLGLDALADVWATTALGGDSACPESTPRTPWNNDGVHLDATGQTIQANAVAATCLALSGW